MKAWTFGARAVTLSSDETYLVIGDNEATVSRTTVKAILDAMNARAQSWKLGCLTCTLSDDRKSLIVGACEAKVTLTQVKEIYDSLVA